MLVHNVLKNLNIGHIIYGSYSHYAGGKGNRYRIILVTQKPYNKEQLAATAEALVLLINHNLDEELLAYAKENSVFAQAWYYPRKLVSSDAEPLYIEYLNGIPIEVYDPEILPPPTHMRPKQDSLGDDLSPIKAFNKQNSLAELLTQYGYKRKLAKHSEERWLSPDSTSNKAGMVLRGEQVFSHHNNRLNDGYWHDAFDFMMVHEGLSQREAVIRAAQLTIAPDGMTIDQHNKTVQSRLKIKSKPSAPSTFNPGVSAFIYRVVLR